MKAIIEGVRYDTDKAQLVASVGSRSGTSTGDHRWWQADLYHTEKGAWFLAGKGGPASVFAEPADQHGWTGRTGIIPLSGDAARGYLETVRQWDVLEQYATELGISDA